MPSKDEMSSSVDEGRAVDVICLDLGKVFDRISYCTFVSGLGHHGEER